MSREAYVANCQTCGWKSELFFFDVEGGEDYARASVIITTRLGHLMETARRTEHGLETHSVEYRSVTNEPKDSQ